MAYSRNVVAAKVALQAREDDRRSRSQELYGTWTRLGFGSKTGIDVANEIPGILRDPADAVAPDRPRQRRVRAGRRRDPDPARRCPTPRW